ncbi:MAG: serine hydrolase [Candidatus Sericytochromatia bacterium]
MVGVYAKNISTGKTYRHNAKRVFPSASVIKLPILYLLYEEISKGEISLEQKISFTEKDIVDDSPYFESLVIKNGECNLYDVAHSMITVSDNTSTNLLIDLLGFDSINKKIKSLGMEQTILNRKMCDFETRQKGIDNLTTPEDFGLFFKHISFHLKGLTLDEILNCRFPKISNLEEASVEMVKILSEQKDLEKIPSGFTSNKNIFVANKPGELPNIRNDVALIIKDEHHFVISIFTEQVNDEVRTDEIIGKFSKDLLYYLENPSN